MAAPYGQFVSSEPAGPGLYRFGLKDGSSVTYGGAPAEDLNKKLMAGMPDPNAGALANNDVAAGNFLDRPGVGVAAPSVADVPAPSVNAQAGQAREGDGPGLYRQVVGKAAELAPNLVAGIPGVGPLGGAIARGAVSAADALTGGKPVPKGEAPVARKEATGAAPATGGPTQQASAVSEQAMPGQQQQPQGDITLPYSMEAVGPNGQKVYGPAIQRPDGSIGVYVAPSRGSPGGFTKLGQATLQQHAETEAGASTLEGQAQTSKAAGVQAEVENLAAQQGAAEEAKWAAAVQANDQQEEIKAIQARADALEGVYRKASDEANSMTIDENRYMKGSRGTLSAIGMALGAFGAVLGKSPNFAQQFVDGQIDRDIRSQEAELKIKGKKADNALGDFTRELGSLSNAKVALKQIMGEKVAADLRSASLTGQDKAKAAYAGEVAALQEASNLRTNEQRQMAFREHLLSNSAYYQQGRAGSTGGFMPVSQDSYLKGQQGEIDKQKLKIQQAKEADAAGRAPHIGQRQQSQIISAKVAGGAIQEYADALGVQRGKDGEYQDPSTTSAIASKIPYSDTRQKVTALKNTLVAEVGKAQIGGVLSEGEAHTMQEQIEGANTPGEIGTMLRHYDRTMKHVEETVREVAASSGPGSDNPDEEQARR